MKFCTACGAARLFPCPACGVPTEPGEKFCGACGSPLQAGVPAPAASPEAVPPSGERKQITVLFVDVAGSMELASGMDPEQWGDLMGRFFALVRDGVNRFGGRIDKFTGDGVMALFGAPIAHEDHARRACAAALHLQEELARYSAELERDRGVCLVVRMGLNSGEVVATAVGEDLKVEYTAVGSTVGVAQRMEALAEPGAVYLSEATAHIVEGFFELRPLGRMMVKGLPEAMAVFALVGRGVARTPLEVAAARGLSRFVGRDSEMATLEGALARVAAGNGQVIGVVAGPGVGKSRLCYEFAKSCRARGLDVLAAHALAHTQSVPFVPVLEMLRSQFGITDQDEDADARAKIADGVLELDGDLGDALPLLFDFLGLPDPERPSPAIDPEARQRQLFGVFDRLRRARSSRGPVVFIVEDLHWLDPGSEAFLENLVNGTPELRVLVVTTTRPEYRAPWVHRTYYGQVPLSPLGADASRQLLEELLGTHPSLDGLADLVADRTGRNPFFIQEVVQGLVEEGSLVGERGACHLVRTVGELRIPATVQAVLAARIDRLPQREKTLLQTASVIGRHFAGWLAGHVAGSPGEEVQATLRSLLDAEFIYETGTFPEPEYAFKHALTEEVAYRSLLAKDRARLHRAVAAALAEVDAAAERASLIAHHYELGGERLDAARWNARAAVWAGSSHPVEAARHWRRVRTLTDDLGPSTDAAELGMEARWQLIAYLVRLGTAGEEGGVPWEDEARQLFAETEARALASGQPGLLAMVRTVYAVAQMQSDRLAEGYEASREAARLADETGDPGVRCTARSMLEWGLFCLGHVPEAYEVARELAGIIGDDRSVARGGMARSMYAFCQLHLAQFRHHSGRLDEGLLALERVIEIAGEEDDLEIQSWAHRAWVIFADWAGIDPVVASVHLDAALDLAEATGSPWSRVFVREGVATGHAHRGEWDRAIAVVDEALAIVGGRRMGYSSVPHLLALRARAQLGQDDVSGARTSAGEALASAIKMGTRFYEAQARHQLGRALLASQQPNEARAELDRALSLVEVLGISAYAPQIHADLAYANRAVGELPAYENELRTAHRRFIEAGAPSRACQLEAIPGRHP
jgi:class 3 adenylate cyclase/tetratricopeptide (TPR) repeat protein